MPKSKALSLEHAQLALRREQQRTQPAFFDHPALVEIATAVKEREPTVVVKDREFTLDYTRVSDAVYVNPVKGFVPCGYFHYQRLEDHLHGAEWE